MAEEKNEEIESKDPWDFEDPEVTEVPESVPDSDHSDSSEEEDELPDGIIARAKEAGLDDDDLSKMGSKDQLEFVLNLLESKAKEAVSEDDSTATGGDAEETPSDDVSWIDDIDPEEAIDSDSAKAVKAMKAKIDRLTSQLESMNKSNEANKTDGLFNQLEDEWSEVFGSDKEQNTQQVSNRKSVLEEIDVLKDGYRSRKKRMPSEKEIFDRAVHGVFGEQAKEFARQELSGRLKNRESQFISRASNTNSSGDMLTGRDKAVQNVANKMKDIGFAVSDQASEIFE